MRNMVAPTWPLPRSRATAVVMNSALPCWDAPGRNRSSTISPVSERTATIGVIPQLSGVIHRRALLLLAQHRADRGIHIQMHRFSIIVDVLMHPPGGLLDHIPELLHIFGGEFPAKEGSDPWRLAVLLSSRRPVLLRSLYRGSPAHFGELFVGQADPFLSM